MVITLMVGFAVFVVMKAECNRLKLNGKNRMSIGVIDEYHTAHFRFEYDYSFKVNGKIYTGRSKGTDIKPKDMMSKKFYVKFYTTDPDISEILLDKLLKIQYKSHRMVGRKFLWTKTLLIKHHCELLADVETVFFPKEIISNR